MKETGDLLRKIREEKGVSIEDVVLATKIKKSTLIAIEEGDLKQLPSKTFIRGFVQSYARYLQTDTERVLEVFHTEMGTTIEGLKGTPNQTDPATDENAVKFANSNRHPLIKVFIGVGSLVLIGMIYIVSNTIDKYQTEKQLIEPTQEEAKNIKPIEPEETEKSEELNADQAVTESVDEKIVKPEMEETTEANDKILKETAKAEKEKKEADEAKALKAKQEAEEAKKKEQEKLAAEKKRQEEEKAKAEEEAAAKLKAEEKEKERLAAEAKAAEEKKKQEEARLKEEEEKKKLAAQEKENKVEPKKVSASFIPQEVIIEALDAVEVEFRTDKGSWVEINLKPEQIHTIKGRNHIDVKISDGGAINLIHNGKVLGVPGTLGSELSLSYPQ